MGGSTRSFPEARHDGVAAWFDRELATSAIGLARRAAAQRLLGPGPGRLLDVGCGGGSHAVAFADDSWVVTDGPGVTKRGLRAKVGAVHITLGHLLTKFIDQSFELEVVEEPETREYLIMLALRWRR